MSRVVLKLRTDQAFAAKLRAIAGRCGEFPRDADQVGIDATFSAWLLEVARAIDETAKAPRVVVEPITEHGLPMFLRRQAE